MQTPIDASRRTQLVRVAKTIFQVVALIAIAAAVDVLPGKFAELSVWSGLGLFLLAAGSPTWLLDRCVGPPTASQATGGQG